MMLQHILDTAIQQGLIRRSRQGPMRTAVKQFAAMFGMPADQLPPERYHLPRAALFRFIEQHIGTESGVSKLRNTKNNLAWLLSLAEREHWLRAPGGDVQPWANRYRSGARTRRLYRARVSEPETPAVDGARLSYALLLSRDLAHIPLGLRQHIERRRAGLQLAPQPFLDEVRAYLHWCQVPHAGTDRPARIKKRPITSEAVQKALLRLGGYAHHIAGIPLDELSLDRLTEPAFVDGYVAWWVNDRRGRVTCTITDFLEKLRVIAKFWLKQPERAKALHEIRLSLQDGGPVFDKESALVPLKDLERAGLGNYPFTPERLQRREPIRALYRHLQDPEHVPMPPYWRSYATSKRVGTQVMTSLIIRLLVRLPMRQRCIREMKLDHNLRKRPDGDWEVCFRGAELKIASRKHVGMNEYRHTIPRDLTPLIEQWLTVWRPHRLPDGGSPLIFLTESGNPLADDRLRRLFRAAVYRFTGRRTTIHMVRDSWATEYLDATGDVAGCAEMLGDTVEMVLRHYAHVLKNRAQGRTSSWLQTQLAAD
jgi:integrase